MSLICPGCQRTLRKDVPRCPMCGTDIPSETAAPATEETPAPTAIAPAGQEVAFSGFWRRVVAFFIDSSIISLIRFALGLALMLIAAIPAVGLSQMSAGLGIAALVASLAVSGIVVLAVGLVYYAYFESSEYRATPGKLVMQAYVGDANGAPVTFMRALARNAAKFLSTIIFGIGYLLPIFTARKQALHDIVASTVVLRKPEASTERFLIGIAVAVLINGITYGVSEYWETSHKHGAGFKVGGLSSGSTDSEQQDFESQPAEDSGLELSAPDQAEVVESPEESSAAVEASPNVASVAGKSLDFSSEVALLQRGGSEILVGLYRNPLDSERLEQIKSLGVNDPHELQADLTVGFKFKRGSAGCSAEDLSSYSVSFRSLPEGFVLPENRDSIEFSRAVTSERSREGIALSCERKDGNDLVVALIGTGGRSSEGADPLYSWNLAFKTTLAETK